MNGAIADPESMTSTPSKKSTRRIGVSHHFLLFRRKSENSAISPGSFVTAARSKSFCSERLTADSWYTPTRIGLKIGESTPADPSGLAADSKN